MPDDLSHLDREMQKRMGEGVKYDSLVRVENSTKHLLGRVNALSHSVGDLEEVAAHLEKAEALLEEIRETNKGTLTVVAPTGELSLAKADQGGLSTVEETGLALAEADTKDLVVNYQDKLGWAWKPFGVAAMLLILLKHPFAMLVLIYSGALFGVAGLVTIATYIVDAVERSRRGHLLKQLRELK